MAKKRPKKTRRIVVSKTTTTTTTVGNPDDRRARAHALEVAKRAVAVEWDGVYITRYHGPGTDSGTMWFRSRIRTPDGKPVDILVRPDDSAVLYWTGEDGRPVVVEVAAPFDRENPYLGDAVALADYRKKREKWEKGGRKGPPPPPPRQRELQAANPRDDRALFQRLLLGWG